MTENVINIIYLLILYRIVEIIKQPPSNHTAIILFNAIRLTALNGLTFCYTDYNKILLQVQAEMRGNNYDEARIHDSPIRSQDADITKDIEGAKRKGINKCTMKMRKVYLKSASYNMIEFIFDDGMVTLDRERVEVAKTIVCSGIIGCETAK